MILDTNTISSFYRCYPPQAEIGQLVYSPHGLTPEEIAVIEEACKDRRSTKRPLMLQRLSRKRDRSKIGLERGKIFCIGPMGRSYEKH